VVGIISSIMMNINISFLICSSLCYVDGLPVSGEVVQDG
jgi:hypothetical protein